MTLLPCTQAAYLSRWSDDVQLDAKTMHDNVCDGADRVAINGRGYDSALSVAVYKLGTGRFTLNTLQVQESQW